MTSSITEVKMVTLFWPHNSVSCVIHHDGLLCCAVLCCAVCYVIWMCCLFLSAMSYSEESIKLWSERDVGLWLQEVRREGVGGGGRGGKGEGEGGGEGEAERGKGY